jgi:hypothetical protein
VRWRKSICNEDARALFPPFVTVAAGDYALGVDIEEIPEEYREEFQHAGPARVTIHSAFDIAQFPVTNAEWGRFMAAGGYDDLRWWQTAGEREWQAGKGTGEAKRCPAWCAAVPGATAPCTRARPFVTAPLSVSVTTSSGFVRFASPILEPLATAGLSPGALVRCCRGGPRQQRGVEVATLIYQRTKNLRRVQLLAAVFSYLPYRFGSIPELPSQ